MYERTIAGEFRIYTVTTTVTPTPLYDLLSVGDKLDFDNLLNTGETIQPFNYASTNTKVQVRVPVDGYMVSESDFKVRSHVTGIDETAKANVQYTVPVYFWPKKTWVSSDSGATLTVRIFFS
jgi:hypothetical protein